MSIIIQFNSPSYIQSAGVPSNIPCHSKKVKLEMVPGIERSDMPIMTDNDGSIIDITKNGVFATTLKDVRTSHYCFGLPYQDHNYGAPPPPTPPSYSPCPSPAAVVAIAANEDSNHSIASTTTEDAPEESVTRCICGFEHDDEYMICCDNCLVWQHIDCMDLDRNNIPETYLCEKCEPRKLDRHKAKLLQARKKSVLTKIPPAQQETNANNLVFGKNYKKNTLLHSPEQWQQVNTGSQPQRFYGSTDSDEETKNNDRRPKTRSKRKKRDDERDPSLKKSKLMTKNGRERMEMKRSSLRRRNKNKESTSTADEEAQDAWAYSTDWCEENFESAATNQYTPEVQHLARMLRPLGHEKKFYDQLQSKKCHIIDDGKKKQLVSLYDIPRNQPLIEYKGKYLLASQFHDLHPLYNKRLYPYIMFYTVDQTEICVDSSMYGNDARFVRRSCKPNAEIRHMSYNGNLHLFLQSTKVIFSEDEITVPLNFNQCDSIKDVVCSCGAEDCFLKPKKRNGSVEVCQEKRRRTRRSTILAEDESSQSVLTVAAPENVKASPQKMKTYLEKVKPTPEKVRSSPEKVKPSEKIKPTPEKVKPSPEKLRPSPEKVKPSPEKIKASLVKNEIPEPPVSHVETNEPEIDTKPLSDHDGEEPSIEEKKKMTREQRKIEAYMRAFNQMEKAQRRKQQSQKKQKVHHPKSEEKLEKPESTENVVEEEKPTPEPEVLPEKEEVVEEEVKVQPPTPTKVQPPTPTKVQPPTPTKVQPTKTKKGKRRRGSGTPIRRRTRTNSGGSEVLLALEEIKQVVTEPEPTVEPTAPDSEPVNEPVNPIPCPVADPNSPTPSSAEESPKALKTKRLLLQEWLLEKSEEAISVPPTASSSPRTIHTELKWNTTAASATCYVRCTKDTPHSGGISAAHLRRSNSSGHLRNAGGQGSAKKRWLRQAMHDCPEEPLGMDLSIMEHLEGSCLSPSCHGDVDSPGGDDIVTPLKKRRLMRESIESLSSPHSPSLENGMDDTDATTSSLPNDAQIDQKMDTMDQHLLCATNEDSMQLSPEEDSTCKRPEFVEAEESQVKDEILKNDSSLDTILMQVDYKQDNVDTEEIEPCKTEKVEPCKTEEMEPSKTEKVKPCKIEDIEPCKVEGKTSCNSEETKHCKMEETKPCKMEETKPCKMEETKPCKMEGIEPCKTEEVKPSKMEEIERCKTEEIKLCKVEETKPCKAEKNKPFKVEGTKPFMVEETKPCKVEETKPCNMEETKPFKIEETKPCKMEESKPCKMEESKPCKIEEIKPCKAEDIKPYKMEEIKPFKTEDTSMQINKQITCLTLQTDCGVDTIVNGNLCDETINNPILTQDNGIKTSSLKQVLPDPESSANSACHMNSPRALDMPSDSDNISSVNQSVKAIKAENIANENTLAQKKQSLDFSAAPIALSPVNKISPIEIKCTSSITHDLEPITGVESPESIKHFSLGGASRNHTSNIKLPVQEPTPANKTSTSEVDISNADKSVNSKDHSTSDRPPDLSVTFEKTVCSKDSSCSNIADSNSVDSCFIQTKQSIDFSTDILIKANGVKDTQVRIQCIAEEVASPVKACASATQKRKVSLSEYRMRMRENSGKSRTNSDPAKNSVDGISTTTQKLPAQVTLAPLPLFDVGDSSKDQTNKQSGAKKKKDTTSNEEDSKSSEHRENLNERLKREFGFDVSEDSASFLQTKSKCNNQSSSDPPVGITQVDPQSLPPPPPPPRPMRPPQPAVIGGGPTPIAAPQYGYVHPPLSRPPYFIPQVPVAPYLPPQAPILPPLHQLPPNGNLRAPLLPSAHSFAPGTLMRQHTPANAQQRFATQPRAPYLHVYPSGLYK